MSHRPHSTPDITEYGKLEDEIARLNEQLRLVSLDRDGWEGLANQHKHKRSDLEEQLEAALDLIRRAPDMDSLELRDECREFVESNPASSPDDPDARGWEARQEFDRANEWTPDPASTQEDQ